MRYPATLRMFLPSELCLTVTIYSGSTALAEVGALLSPNCYINLKRVTCQLCKRKSRSRERLFITLLFLFGLAVHVS